MEKANEQFRIPGIDDRPMTEERLAQMWQRLAEQEEEIFVGDSSESRTVRPVGDNPVAV